MVQSACICSRVLLVCACSVPVFPLCSTSTSSTCSSSVCFCCWQGCPLLQLLLLQCSCCSLPGLCCSWVASVPALLPCSTYSSHLPETHQVQKIRTFISVPSPVLTTWQPLPDILEQSPLCKFCLHWLSRYNSHVFWDFPWHLITEIFWHCGSVDCHAFWHLDWHVFKHVFGIVWAYGLPSKTGTCSSFTERLTYVLKCVRIYRSTYIIRHNIDWPIFYSSISYMYIIHIYVCIISCYNHIYNSFICVLTFWQT